MATTPDADHDYTLTYIITQNTTSRKPSEVMQAFFDELKLQYGSTVTMDNVLVRDNKRPNQWAKRLDPPEKTYQEQREDGDVVEPDGDVLYRRDDHPSGGLDIT